MRCSSPLYFVALVLALVGRAAASEPKLISGTYIDGSNVTEPRPVQSKYLQTVNGGVVVIGEVAGFYLNLSVRESPTSPLYIRIEYQDPLGNAPATNDMVFLPEAKGFQFSSPGPVQGLRAYVDYQILVTILENKDSTESLDTLSQTIRSYVDTTGKRPKVFRGVKARE